jgi:two-component system, chemotaxis family, CheB/CheR fusion protein
MVENKGIGAGSHEDLLEALRRSEERLRVTMESAVDFAIITTNTEGLIEEWNTGAERIFGYNAEDAKGKRADIIFTPEDKAAGIPDKEMQSAVEKGYAEDERWHIRKDGTRFFMSGVMRPIYNPQLTGFVKVARNITQQKLLEQQKDDFIGIASHELKTPITSIRIYAEILQ